MDSANCSVVIPAYNEQETIARTLEAILKQKMKPGEVIVVNNASTDNTQDIVKTKTEAFRNAGISLKIVGEEKKGVAKARNKGFYESRYPIIVSTDADSVPREDWIERLMPYFEDKKIAAVTGITVMEDAPAVARLATELGWYELITRFLKMVYGWQTITTANCAIRKETFVRAGGFDENCVSVNSLDDTELSSRLADFGAILIDRKIKVDTSIRRYREPFRAVSVTIARLKRWKEISDRKQNRLATGEKKG